MKKHTSNGLGTELRHGQEGRGFLSRRAAYAHPRMLAAGMSMLMLGSAWWAMAQRGTSTNASAPVKTKAASSTKRQVANWNHLPQLMQNYGLRKAAASLRGAPATSATGAMAAGPRRFALTETNLTPGNLSDEREPSYRPAGDYIAFASNGVDANNDGVLDAGGLNAERRYHIWIMRRDGSQVRQITGLGSDRNRDQRSPSWSSEGTRLVYVDSTNATSSDLYVVSNIFATTPVVQRITFFGGTKRDPSWSPAGNAIAFASNAAPGPANSTVPLNQYDIFTIDPEGSSLTVRRLTGDADGRQTTSPSPTDPQDLLGNTTDDWKPAFSLLQPNVVFFSSNRQRTDTTVTQSTGRRIWAMNSFNGSGKRQVTDPLARTNGTAADIDDSPAPSLGPTAARPNVISERLAFESNSLIDGSDRTKDLNLWSVPVNTTDVTLFLGTNRGTVESSLATAPNLASLESNVLSSPANVTAARFTGITEDRSADREPNFSRATSTAQLSSSIVFASQRRVAPRPGPNSANPTPVVVNPGGGTAATSTHDLWTTISEDLTPPLLVPVSAGNQQFPFVAPGRQAPFFAPRTAEEGLSPGGKLIVAVVLSEPESGLSNATSTTSGSVSFQIRDADQPLFTSILTQPNDGVNVRHDVEQAPQIVTDRYEMTVYDDGPVSQGGNERQANAIRGDGLYYGQSSIEAIDINGNPLNGDFYIDLFTTDRAGNNFIYDNVYGFSTRAFQQQANLLFVSDYTVGQNFPLELLDQSDAGGRTFEAGIPVESYWLLNPGGVVSATTGPGGTPSIDQSEPGNGSADQTTFSPPDTYLPNSRTSGSTFGVSPTSVDIWRVLSRGDVPIDVLRTYRPSVTQQLDPTADPNNDNIPGPFVSATRNVTVAERAVVWASPYTGSVYAGPGTLFDTETQRRLTDFLSNGGRLFVSGQDIIFALTNAGQISNTFLAQELAASWAGETPAGDVGRPTFGYALTGTNDAPIVRRTRFITNPLDPPAVLHVPFNPASPLNNTYYDAANNDFFLDIIGSVTAGTDQTINRLYTYGTSADLAAQRIERRNRQNGLESRTVFFGFGLETINREYTTAQNLSPARNYRAKVADNIANYLRTGTISGRVINAETNLPIPNFLVQVLAGVNSTEALYIARTDQNGNYEIKGVPSGNYVVTPARYVVNGQFRSLNPGYFVNNAIVTTLTIIGGQTTDGVNFRVNPSPPSTITGRAISDRGTTDTSDDANPEIEVAPNLPVLLRSPVGLFIPPSDSFPAGGRFAAITQTDASGRFVFTQVPADLPVEIVFNPRPGFQTQGGDIPDGTTIDYGTPTSLFQPNPNFGRRVLPVDNNYNGPRPTGIPANIVSGTSIIVPVGTSLDIGDVPIPPRGVTITIRVTRGGVATQGATVQLTLNGQNISSGTTDVNGRVVFDNVQRTGTYTAIASFRIGTTNYSGSTTIVVTQGNNATGTIALVVGTATPGPTATPTASPSPTAAPSSQFTPGRFYMISIPYADSTAITSVTTVAKAFTVPMVSKGVVNFELRRYNPLTKSYEALGPTSIIRRGEGYFFRSFVQGVDIKRPPTFGDRKPLVGTQFTITLRSISSLRNDPTNGYNLIGYPFDPAKYKAVNWTLFRVISADGRTSLTLQQAIAAGWIDGGNQLTILDESGSSTYTKTTVMEPFKGYFIRTYIDGLKLVLRAG
jgi:hypothetical protein